MESVTKKRILFWGIVCTLMLIFALVGFNKYKDGYGKYGKIRQKLIPISEKYNTIDYIIRYGGLSSEVKRDKIYFYNKTDTISEKIVCRYDNKNSYEYELLKCEFDSKLFLSNIFTKGIIDTIFMVNGNKESIFKEYELNEFTKLKLENGFEYSKGDKTIINIDINTKIYDKLTELGMDEIVVPAIIKKDLEKMWDELETNHTVTIKKNTKTIYITENETNYILYCQDTNKLDNENFTTSVLNVLFELNGEVYDAINASTDKINSNFSNDLYVITKDVGNNTLEDIFKSGDNITRIIINKP